MKMISNLFRRVFFRILLCEVGLGKFHSIPVYFGLVPDKTVAHVNTLYVVHLQVSEG